MALVEIPAWVASSPIRMLPSRLDLPVPWKVYGAIDHAGATADQLGGAIRAN
jgi:hypothetical protein